MPEFVAASNSDEDKAVPVEVKMVVWVQRGAWQDEYGIDPFQAGYDFEEAVQEWFIAENQESVEQDAWPSVTQVTP